MGYLIASYMTKKVGHHIGDFIGKFLEYDTNNNSSVWREYVTPQITS